MSPALRNLLLGLLLGAAAGFCAGFLGSSGVRYAAGRADGPLSLAPGAEPRMADGADLPEAPLLAGPGADGERALAPVAERSAAARVSDAKVRALASAVAVPELERRSAAGSIWGQVTDAAGLGVADVVLRARPTSGYQEPQPTSNVGQAPPDLDGLEETVRKAAEHFAEERAQLFETATDEGGAYRFEGLPEGIWYVRAYKLDFVFEEVGSARVATGSMLDFTAQRVTLLRVDVVGVDGSPVPTAVVECTRSGSRNRATPYAWSPAEPVLRLSPGKYTIAALGETLDSTGWRESMASKLRSEEQTVDLREGEEPAPLLLVLDSRAGILGRLVFPRDVIREVNARVFAAPVPAGTEPDLKQLARSDRNEQVGSGGDFAFLDLEPGTYVVGAARTWSGDIVAHEVVEVADSLVAVDLELPPVDLAEFIVARTFGSDGRALSGDLSFQFRHEHEGGSSSGGMPELTTREGTTLLTVPPDAREDYEARTAGHKFSIEVRHAEYGGKRVDLAPGQREIEVTFAVPATLVATVARYRGSGYEGRLSVSVRSDSEGPRSYGGRDDGLNAAGEVTLEALEPGAYVVMLQLRALDDPNRWSRTTISQARVDLASGANSLQLAIPPLYSLAVRAPELSAGQQVQVYAAGEGVEQAYFGRRRQEVDAKGQAVFDELPGGRYIVRGGSAQMEVEVPCGEVLLERQETNALRVSVRSDTGFLAKAGFRSGDLVIGVDGTQFSGSSDMALLAAASRTATLMVQREGEVVEIRVQGLPIGDSSALGGSLSPTAR